MKIEEFKSRLLLPVIAAPMFLVSGTKLVVEACKSGVVGTFPSLNGRSTEDFEKMLIEITNELKEFEDETGKTPAPYGVNIIVNKTNPRVMSDLQLCMKYKVPLVITSLGAVKDLVNAVHSYGGLVFHDVIKKRHAEKAAEAGVDGIIAVAAGAGGHAGTASPFALIKEIKSVFNGAILLSGAINTGADILAAQIMGADFAYIGTRFNATEESLSSSEFKKMLVDTDKIDDIIYTSSITGVNANFMKCSIEKAGIDLSQRQKEDFSKLNGEAKAWKDVWSAGHGAAGIHAILKTSDLVKKLGEEYEAALKENIHNKYE